MEPDIERAIELADSIKRMYNFNPDKQNMLRIDEDMLNLADAFFKIHLFYQRGQGVIDDLKKCVMVMECPLEDFEDDDEE